MRATEIAWRGKSRRVFEQGRRVHGWQLTHDVMLAVATKDPEGAFRAYWDDAVTSDDSEEGVTE